jgi:archaellum component FlaC
VHRLSAQLTIINRDNLHSIEEVEWKVESLKTDYEKMRGEINQLSEENEHLSSLITQAELYFSLKDKPDLSDMEQLRLTVSRQSMENNNITSANQIGYLKQTLRNMNEKQAALKENFNRCQQLYAVYSDIAKTYREISKGDYISNLVQEKQKEEEHQRKQAVKR